MNHRTSYRLMSAAGIVLGAVPLVALAPASAAECYGAPRTTSTSLVVTTSGAGRDVVVTVAYTDQGSGAAPTGTVEVSDAGGSLGGDDLDSAGRASVEVSDVAPGSRLTASYTPGSGSCVSPSAAAITVPTKPGTTTSTGGDDNRTPSDTDTDDPGTTSGSLGGTGAGALTEVLTGVGVVLVGAGATGVVVGRRRMRTDR